MTSRTLPTAVALSTVTALLAAVPASASAAPPPDAVAHPPAVAQAGAVRTTTGIPDTISLPTGFQPEGIAIGRAPYAYLGSLADGSIYRANLLTGSGRIISQGPGSPSVGMQLDRFGRLFVAGGPSGEVRVIDINSGEVLASYQLATGTTLINDVTLTPDSAWFTDSRNAVLYRLPMTRHGGLPTATEVVRLPLGGQWQQLEGFNANGITGTPDGRALLVVHSDAGRLYRVDPGSGKATEVDLGGQSLTNGDGMLLVGRTLYVVRNWLNEVVVIRLDRAGTEGTVTGRLTAEGFDVPTTVAAWGGRLYLPNARFGIAEPEIAEYSVTAIDPN